MTKKFRKPKYDLTVCWALASTVNVAAIYNLLLIESE